MQWGLKQHFFRSKNDSQEANNPGNEQNRQDNLSFVIPFGRRQELLRGIEEVLRRREEENSKTEYETKDGCSRSGPTR